MGKDRIARYSIYALHAVAFVVCGMVLLWSSERPAPWYWFVLIGVIAMLFGLHSLVFARYHARVGGGGRLYSNPVVYVAWGMLALTVGMLVIASSLP